MLLAYGLQNGSLPVKNWLAALTLLLAWSWALFFGMRHGTYIGDHESPARVFVYGVPAVLTVWMVLQMELQNEWRWIAKLSVLGDRSYSAYLLHAPILAGLLPLAARLVPHADWIEAFLITVGAILFLALPIELCYRFVEKPSHAWGKYLASLLRSRRPVN
jgi:peptidoglycan/LPS O-acetylase OafA/YrhL